MTIREKIELLKAEPPTPCCLADYYRETLDKVGMVKQNYYVFMTTEPINCDAELKRVDTADFDLCCALMTMLFREDHYSGYGSFDNRYENGDVQKIIDRMVVVLQKKDDDIRRRLLGREDEYLMFMDD